MSTQVAASRTRGGPLVAASAGARERWARRRVGLAWALLFLNVLTFYAFTWNGLPLLVPIPHRIGELITQGALPAALLVALTVNRQLRIRPNAFLCLLSLLVVAAILSLVHPGGHGLGTWYRTVRLAGFVGALWLLTPWWGRRDLLLVRYHLMCLSVVLGSVFAGLLVSPGSALSGGRLSGVFWPIPPTEVADFAAVAIGLMVVLGLCRLVPGWTTIVFLALAGLMLVLARARTELVGLMAGLLFASLSLFTISSRVRKLLAAGGVAGAVGAIAFSALTHWLARGENTGQLTNLTGRTLVWSAMERAPRDVFQMILGNGLSNKSFDGLPIDSTWFTAYWDIGFVGIALCASLLLFVMASACLRPRSPQRALAIFLVTYLLVRSITETALSDASVNLLELALAASLLVPPLAAGRSGGGPRRGAPGQRG